MENFTVTPWEVNGSVDYDKLIKQFGTTRIDEKLRERMKKTCGDLHPMLKRDFVFSHRDLGAVLDDYEKGSGFFLYTGRGPSKSMHIGHIVPLLFTKWLQDKFKVNLYIEITDDEKFLYRKEYEWKDVQATAQQNILDIIAVGFDPERTFIFKDSEYVKNVYPLLMKTARKITASTVKAVFGFNDSTNIGLSFYPAYQVIPTFFEKKRCLIPAAIDQDPYWRVQRDVAEGLGYYKTAAIHTKFLPPLQGVSGKMSSSGGAETAILLTDDEKTVKNKINKYAFSGGQPTVEEHRRLGGNTDIDVPYQWLSILFEPDDLKLKKIQEDYRGGKLLTGEMKMLLIDKINTFLKEHHEKRKKAEKEIDKFMYTGSLAKTMWGKIHE
ncbi:Tryptophan--tRNA ligase [Candidatus Bilamarchaeum dharawalense]|uniref:Tryptophan--tRNA ligase n=1 Tax=Candidatus Bilamarchaeum dharawalense TaxID=2885759 RepID=A0A5E4LTQ7_9ARCH|nr:Tryptophan--tRNA ligase [Candidatus Bilamarchaeum dharawalense]